MSTPLVRVSKKELKRLRDEIKRRVAAQLPEDEHDYTANWVYDVAIQTTLDLLVVDCWRASGRRVAGSPWLSYDLSEAMRTWAASPKPEPNRDIQRELRKRMK